MNISIYTSSITRTGGGLFNAMQGLYLNPTFKDQSLTMFSYKDEKIHADLESWKNQLKINLYQARKFRFSRKIRNDILSSNTDILHVHGLWQYPHLFMETWKEKRLEPLVCSPHGMLDSYILREQGWLKRLIGKTVFINATNAVDCFHALCLKELQDIRAYGIKKPIAVIPNGINLPNNIPHYEKKDNKFHLLYLGRLHKKKGIDMLLNAIGLINRESPQLFNNWTIDIVGWDHENYIPKLQEITYKNKINDIIHFHGGLFGAEKDQIYANSDAFILPSHGEGLPMSVLEAWSWSLPTLITPCCNLPEGYKYNAAIKIEDNIESIVHGLKHLFLMSNEERINIGKNGRELVEKQFTWDKSADKLNQLYLWMINGGEMPPFVYI